jgi:hypothetical protein
MKRGDTHTEAARQKMRFAKLGIPQGPLSEAHRQKLSKSHEGKKHSPETYAKVCKGLEKARAVLAEMRERGEL